MPSRGDVTDRLQRVVMSILDTDGVETNVNLYTIGLTSVSTVQLLAEIERRFGVRVSLEVLLRGPTIEQLASVITPVAESPTDR